jgi:uncharacterized protein (TIGR00251 family)
MIALEQHAAGVVVPVKALPGARKNALRGVHEGELKVAVTQVAEKGKANQAILAFLATLLNLRPAQLELVSGETASHKRILVRGLTQEEVLQLFAFHLTAAES